MHCWKLESSKSQSSWKIGATPGTTCESLGDFGRSSWLPVIAMGSQLCSTASTEPRELHDAAALQAMKVQGVSNSQWTVLLQKHPGSSLGDPAEIRSVVQGAQIMTNIGISYGFHMDFIYCNHRNTDV